MDPAVRELDEARREMDACLVPGGAPCPAVSALREVGDESASGPSRADMLHRVIQAIDLMEGCLSDASRCRPHYLVKDVFLRLSR